VARPGEGFAKRTLAAAPLGSICGKLGLNVARLGLAEAIHESIQAAAEGASTILTGGVTVTTKKVIVIVVAVIFLAAGVTGHIVSRARRTVGGRASPESGTVELVEGSSENATSEVRVPSEPLTVERIIELLREGSPDAQSRTAKEYAMRNIIRDALESTGSMEEALQLFGLIAKGMNLPSGFDMPQPAESLPLFLAFYDVQMNSENWSRVQGGLMMASAHEIEEQSKLIGRMYLNEGRAEEARQWLEDVIANVEAYLAQSHPGDKEGKPSIREVAEQYRTSLVSLRGTFTDELEQETKKKYQERDEVVYSIQDLEARLQSGGFADTEEEGRAWLQLARLYAKERRYKESLECYERAAGIMSLDENAQRKMHEIRWVVAMNSLPQEEKYRLYQSDANLSKIGSAMHSYAEEHSGNFPADLEELVQGGKMRRRLLIDPFSGRPYQYEKGLTSRSAPSEVLVKSPGKDGLAVYLYVDGRTKTVLEE